MGPLLVWGSRRHAVDNKYDEQRTNEQSPWRGARTIVTTLLEAPSENQTPPARPLRSALGVVNAYIALTKPRVIELLLVSTVPVMFLAEGGMPSPWLVLATLFGGALAAGSANALNCYIDRDIDEVMSRTARRPLPRHSVSPRSAFVFGMVLGVISVSFLALTTTVLAAVLALAAIAFYVVIYTMILKRRTPQNIVWGGAAGCMPVLIGWSAVTGGLDWPPLILFGVIFLWTPPHYWPLAMKFKNDYARAGVPMLPVVATPEQVSRQIIIYSWLMVACSLLLWPWTGWIYGASALILGGWFLLEAHRLHRRVSSGEKFAPMGLFHRSITYLTLLFAAVAVQALL
ncbi:MAG: protoheme IX farnesyltransferase [Corynebacteriales bacterium]|nr:protoheme IX farnesyltransferase [Mycobacteriales bacterium]